MVFAQCRIDPFISFGNYRVLFPGWFSGIAGLTVPQKDSEKVEASIIFEQGKKQVLETVLQYW